MFNPRVGQKFIYTLGDRRYTGKFTVIDKTLGYFIVLWDHTHSNMKYTFSDVAFISGFKLLGKEKKLPAWF